MKILWFVDILFDTSLNRCTWLEITGYLQKKNEVKIVARYERHKTQFNELKTRIRYIESIKVPFLNRFMTYRNQVQKFEEFCKEFRPDILLFNTNNFILLRKAHKLKKKYGYRMVLDIRTIPVTHSKLRNALENYFFRKSLRFAAEKFDGITYVSKEMKRYCRENWGLPEHSSLVWTSGVDIRKFTSQRKKPGKGTFTLIYHGSMAKNRGLDNMIRAFDLLRSYDIEIILLGSGRGLSYLKKLTSRLKLGNRIVFKPPVPYIRIPEHIAQADAGVLPFPDWKGWNTSSFIKLFEYLACGRPVVATKIPAHTNILQGRDFVFWAEESTPEELAEAVKKAYEARDHYEKLGEKSREFIKHKYTWEKQAEKLERFLKEITSEP